MSPPGKVSRGSGPAAPPSHETTRATASAHDPQRALPIMGSLGVGDREAELDEDLREEHLLSAERVDERLDTRIALGITRLNLQVERSLEGHGQVDAGLDPGVELVGEVGGEARTG